MKNKDNNCYKINNFLTEITFDDFKNIAINFEIKSVWNENYDGDRNLLDYILNNINVESKNFLVAIHTNFEEDCYFDKVLGTLNFIFIDNAEKVIRDRDYWLVFCNQGDNKYSIRRKETQSVYFVHLD